MIEQGEIRRWYPGVGPLDGLEVEIVGVASNGTPVLGLTYIIALPLGLVIRDYPYTHAVAFEAHLR